MSRNTHGNRRAALRLEALEGREVPAVVGGLDPSFATAGKLLVPGVPYTALAQQPDGKLVVVGSSGGDFLVVRFNTNGSLDTTFNTTGFLTVDFALGGGNLDTARSVAIQPDGKVVVVGEATTTANGHNFAVARLTANGALDGTFGTGGKVNIDFGGGGGKDDFARGVAVNAVNNDVYLVGLATNAGGNIDFGVARLSGTTGALVTAFGNNGKEFIDFGGTSDLGRAIAIQADGKLILVGSSDVVPVNGGDFAVARLDPTTGMLDPTFNATGQKIITFGAGDDTARAVQVQTDGKIVVAGLSTQAAQQDAGVARLNANGSLDTTFNATGIETINLGGASDAANAVGIQADGKIVLAGDNATDIAVVRLSGANGLVDATFGPGGLRTFDLNGVDAGLGAVITPTGRVVVTGKTNGSADGFVIRVIGRTEDGQALAVSGGTDGKALVFNPTTATGQYPAAATATVGAIGSFTTGSVRTAVADVNGDGIPDVVEVTGPGTPIRVTVVSGKDNTTALVPAFDPFGGDFTGGGFVAAADIDNDGRAEFVVTPDEGGGPRVSIFSFASTGAAATTRANFLGIDDTNFRGGARAALGDINGDGVQDIAVSAGFLGGPRTALFNGTTLFGTPARLVNDFFAFPGADAVTLRNGVFVSIGDVNGDGSADLIFGGGPGGAPRVFILSGALVSANNVDGAQAAPVANFFVAGNSTGRGGARVAATDADADNKADVAVGSGEGVAGGVRVYLGSTFTTSAEPTGPQALDPFPGAVLAGGVFVG